MKLSCFRSDLRITSKESALEFYRGVHRVELIPVDRQTVLRVEPDNCISLISKECIRNGSAPFHPSLHDPDGALAYRMRRFINAWLRRD